MVDQLRGISSRALVQMQEALADDHDIREAVADACSRTVDSPAWWGAVSRALHALARHAEKVERALAGYQRQTDPSQRERLAHLWRAAINVHIGDLLLQAQNEGSACQLCRQPIPSNDHHHVLDTVGMQVLCTCQECKGKSGE